MDINVTNDVAFGMKAITSLKLRAHTNPKKRITIDSDKLRKANESIKQALKGVKKERFRAWKSASQTILTV